MSIEAMLDALAEDATASLREALRRAYETGYREGLATHGAVTHAAGPSPGDGDPEIGVRADEDVEPVEDEEAAIGPVVKWPAAEHEDEDLESEAAGEPGSRENLAPRAPAVDWGAGSDGPESEPPESQEDDGGMIEVMLKPIFPHATVGTLRERIFKYFALERFEIDVVICRKGDRNRRQLKSTVRLSKYLLEA